MLAIAGVALGILLAVAIAGLLGHISVTLDLPWDTELHAAFHSRSDA